MTPVYPGHSVFPPAPGLHPHPGKQNNHRSCSGPYRGPDPPGFPHTDYKPVHCKNGSLGSSATRSRSRDRHPSGRQFSGQQRPYDTDNRSSCSVRITFWREKFCPAIGGFSSEYACKFPPSAGRGTSGLQRSDRHRQPPPDVNAYPDP